ncbi:MAG: phosphatase PAP2 family protein [Candidatus Parcubacteria bacterium]|nr:phosphatase PAP2 family protein [Candidatus Parcubacteria bacterium]
MSDGIFYFFYNFAHQSIFLDKLVVFSAVYLPYLVIVGAIVFLLFHHEVLSSKNPFAVLKQKWKEISLVFFVSIGARVVTEVLKYLIHADRPFIKLQNVFSLFPETGYSFPSGHATFFMALAFALYFSHKKVGYVFMFFALLIGLARIVGGVHFPIDILGGFIVGFLTSYIVYRFLLSFYKVS